MYSLIQVKFNPASEFRQFDKSAEVRSYFTASAVRVMLVKPANTEPLLSYYAIAQLSIEGQCQCYGHASTCIGPVSHLSPVCTFRYIYSNSSLHVFQHHSRHETTKHVKPVQ